MNARHLNRSFLISVLFSISLGATPPPAEAWQAVSAGGWHTCALRNDGTVACWGYRQATPPSGAFTQVSAGFLHSCGVRTDGTVACWGDNRDGQATPPAGAFTQVSCGDFHTCGLRTNGTLTCWGQNSDGQAPALTLSPISLANGAIGQAYSQTFSAAGGAAPYTFAFTAGSLPPGLSLSAGGSLSGKPTIESSAWGGLSALQVCP